MLQHPEQNMTIDNTNDSKHHWHANNSMNSGYIDYTDSLSQSFLSPMSTSLQDMDDMDYQPSPGKKKTMQSVPMFGESPSEYSLASLGDNNSVYDDFGTSPHTFNSDNGSAYVGPMDIHHHHPQRQSMIAIGNNKFMNDRTKIQQSSLSHYPQQQSIHHSSSSYLPNTGYPSSSSTSSSPSSSLTSAHAGVGPSGFPMSAPANIGYDFHLNARSPMTTSIGSPSTTSQGHMPMTLTPQHRQPPQQSLSGLTQSLEDDYTMQVNLQAMMEKRRRRRESHNAVERRRRENINDRIHELGCLLPESMLEEITNTSNNGGHSPSSTGNSNNNNNNNNICKPNKGAILRKSVDHIRLLQQEANAYRQRVNELELILQQYNGIKPDK